MPDINALVTKNFNENISYIQSRHPDLFSKLAALESAIELGHYSEKYELQYENNYFDVFEKESGSFLYANDSSTHALMAAKSIDHKVEENTFQGFHKQEISEEDLKKYNEQKPFENQMSGFAPIMHYTQEHSAKERTLKCLEKFILFGVGLGLHISAIAQKIDSKVYFIIEDDLELFRLSLFCTNYKELSKRATLIFSVFEDKDAFHKSATHFLEKEHYYNHYIKYFHILSHSDEKTKQFHIEITAQSHLLFFYNALLTQYLKPLDYLFEDYKFLGKSLDFSDTAFDKKPFLILAAGPSLQKNLEWLKKNHKNFIVVALSATLTVLEKEKISPDIITHLDAFSTAKVHFDKLESHEFIKKSVLIFSSRVPQDVVAMFDKEQLFFLENGTQYKDDSLKPSAPCIGSLTYQLLLRLKCKNIYLLGLDLAIDSSTGKTHSDTHEYGKTLDTKENAFDDSMMTFKESLFKADGNLSKSVLTTPHFQTSIDAVNLATEVLKAKEQSVVNLSEGVKFIGTTPMRVEKLSVNKSLKDMKEHILKACNDNSLIGLTSKELNSLKEKQKHANEMLEIVLKHKSIEVDNSDAYLEDLRELCSELTNIAYMSRYELSRVIDTYFRYILGYIFDFFNSHELQEKSEDIENLNNMLLEHLQEIIEFYSDSLKTKLGSE